MSITRHACCERVARPGTFRSSPCARSATVERDGKWYCATHDPVRREAAQAERNRQRNLKWEAARKQRDRAQARLDFNREAAGIVRGLASGSYSSLSAAQEDALSLVDKYKEVLT